MTSVALVANSKITNDSLIKPMILKNDKIIAVDGGIKHCDRMGITPDLIIGDLDSSSEKILAKYQEVPKKVYPKEKDYTDLELAVSHCLEENPTSITLFGVLENRLDHSLSNLYLLTRYPGRIIIESDHETIHCLQEFREFNCLPNQEVSLIPLPSSCKEVSTHGLKWELYGQELNPTFFSLSNVTLGKSFSVSLRKGTLLCCISRS